jgi:plastocyanin
MLQFRVIATVIAAVAMTSCGGSSGGTGPSQNPGPGPGPGGGVTGASVTVSNNNYSPDRVTIARGATVTWHWNSCSGDPYGGGQTCVSHSVTFDDNGPSAAAKEDGSFARTFANAGTFTYYCTTHGRAAMSGSVVVQ